jgi:hypothetical protein
MAALDRIPATESSSIHDFLHLCVWHGTSWDERLKRILGWNATAHELELPVFYHVIGHLCSA